MRAMVQRVLEASVTVQGAIIGRIGPGLLVLVGVKRDDTEAQAEELARRVVGLRIFDDEQGRMNRDLGEAGGELLIVSQFTLYASTTKGNRPSYSAAAQATVAEPLYYSFIKYCQQTGLGVATGVFGADMLVHLVNNGPVTLLCEAEFNSTKC